MPGLALSLGASAGPEGLPGISPDPPAGVRQPSFGWTGFATLVVIVVEPTAKRSSRPDASRGSWPGLPLLGVVPYDDEVRAAEAAGKGPIDAVPDAAAVKSVEGLLASLEDER